MFFPKRPEEEPPFGDKTTYFDALCLSFPHLGVGNLAKLHA